VIPAHLLVLARELRSLCFGLDLCGQHGNFSDQGIEFVHCYLFVSSANLREW
jgi:hypothetical protein